MEANCWGIDKRIRDGRLLIDMLNSILWSKTMFLKKQAFFFKSLVQGFILCFAELDKNTYQERNWLET